MSKKQKETNQPIKQKDISSKRRILKKGAYSSAMIVIVLAIVVIINMIVGRLPSKYIKFDLTNQQLYSISEDSKKVIKQIKDPITIYYLVSSTAEDSNSNIAMLTEMLNKYTELNSNIKVEKKDPALYPTFAEKYEADSNTALIVESSKRYKVISGNDVFEQTYDYNTYEQTNTFNGEEVITSAINYVAANTIPKLYVLQGHKETELSETIQQVIERQSITVNELNLITEDTVPEDAACILINVPKADFTEAEAEKMIAYLKNGGNALIITSYTNTDLPNFDKVLNEYGVQLEKKMVLEGNESMRINSAENIVPSVAAHDTTESITNYNLSVCLPQAQPIKTLKDIRDTITITDLLTTSDQAYAKADTADTKVTDKKSGDEEGPFTVGVAITEKEESDEEATETEVAEESTDDTNVKTKLVLFSSYGMTDDAINQNYVGWTNAQAVIDSLNWMCKYEDNISIPSKSMSTEYLTVTDDQINLWGTIYLGIIPAIIIVTGIVVSARRKRR